MTSQENPVLKYDTIFKTLKTDVISDINNVLLDKFKPIIKEIENDISIFLLIEQLNKVVQELPIFKELDDKYNSLLNKYNCLLDSKEPVTQSDIKLEITDYDHTSVNLDGVDGEPCKWYNAEPLPKPTNDANYANYANYAIMH